MLRAEDNKFLTESGSGTGMGELLRSSCSASATSPASLAGRGSRQRSRTCR